MPSLKFDLGDVWQDSKDILKDAWMLWKDPSEAPPAIRNLPLAFMTLKDNQNNVVGVFVPELYEIALINGLKAQQEEKAWLLAHPGAAIDLQNPPPFYYELHRADDTPKTPFELSVLPVNYDDNVQSSKDAIIKRAEEEFAYRIQKGQPLPPVADKYQIKSDYLKNLHLINLNAGVPRHVQLNILNPAAKTTMKDRVFHYTAQRAALILTAIAALTVTASTPLWFGVAAIGVILAEWCGKEFSTYSAAEATMRNLSSIFAKDFLWGDKISAKKTLKTVALLGALGVATYAVAGFAWAGVAGLSIWNAAAGNAMAGTALLGAKYLLAGFVSGLAAVSTFAGGLEGQRFFWGLGIWDKQIDFSIEKTIAPLNKKAVLEQSLTNCQRELEQALDQSYQPVVRREFTQLRDRLKTSTVAQQPAANDGIRPQVAEDAQKGRRRSPRVST